MQPFYIYIQPFYIYIQPCYIYIQPFYIYIQPCYIYIQTCYTYIQPHYIYIQPLYICIQPFHTYIQPCYIYMQLFKDCIRSHYREKSSTPEILRRRQSSNTSHSNGLKILNLDFTIFCWGIFCSIILIVLCSVNHLKSGKVYLRGPTFFAKFFKMTASSSAKSELTVNSSDFEVLCI